MDAETHEHNEYFTTDSGWLAFIATLEPVITKIATKYCGDDDLREDCKQEARIALASVAPDTIRGQISNYARNVIRNSILSYLSSWQTGPWNIGRTREGVHCPARYVSLEQLGDGEEGFGMEVDERGAVTWVLADDGVANDDLPNVAGPEDSPTNPDPGRNERELIDRIALANVIDSLRDEERQSVQDYIAGLGPWPLKAIARLTGKQVTEPGKPTALHGTLSRFKKGCHCAACLAASDAYNAKRRAGRPPRAPRPPKESHPPKAPRTTVTHGSLTMYRCGCRCEECRAAWRVAYRAQQALNGRTVLFARKKPACPSLTMYNAYGCRCDGCRAAKASYRRSLRERNRRAE